MAALTVVAIALPLGESTNPSTGLISGTVVDDAASASAYQVTVAVDDGVGETTSQTFAWLVNPSPISLQVLRLPPWRDHRCVT